MDSRVSLVIGSFEFALWRMDGFWLVVEAAVSERILKLSRGVLTAPMMQPNGTNSSAAGSSTPPTTTSVSQVTTLVTGPWGIGILRLAGANLTAPMMQPNGTRFGGWLLNTADNEF